MRLLVATHDLYPDPHSGGTGRYVYETCRRLADRGHRISVVTRRRGEVPLRETIAGFDVYRYDLAVADRAAPEILRGLRSAVPAVARHVDAAGRPDVLSLQGPITGPLVDRATDDDVPRACTFHSPWPTEYEIRTRDGDLSAPRRRLNAALRRLVERRTLARSDEVITLSEFMRAELRRTYGPVEATVVPGGVDAARYAPGVTPYGRLTDDGRPRFLTVRRLSPRMGHATLLEAFARVHERHPGARLYVAGDGPLRGELERRARELGIGDATTFLGYVPDEDLPGAYAAADVFVLPTAELEGFGLATLEALASGTPVVGTRVGATSELLSGVSDAPAGMLCEPNAASLARRLDEWAALSPADRRDAGRRCREYAFETYRWERTVEALEARYDRWC